MKDYMELIEELREEKLYQRYTILERKAAVVIEQLVKERDALLFDLCEILEYQPDSCLYCAKDHEICKMRKECEWEWRGVQE